MQDLQVHSAALIRSLEASFSGGTPPNDAQASLIPQTQSLAHSLTLSLTLSLAPTPTISLTHTPTLTLAQAFPPSVTLQGYLAYKKQPLPSSQFLGRDPSQRRSGT